MTSNAPRSAPLSSGFVWLCLALLGGALALVSLGGLVRITGSGLGCPDWPLCHGRLIPPFELAPWIEYLHRLAAAAVSVLVAVFAVGVWLRQRARPWLLWPGTLAPLLLIVQIWLGQLTVLNEIPPATAWVHTAVAMAIVAVLAVPSVAAYPPLLNASARLAEAIPASGRAARLPYFLSLAVLAVYLLLLTGAFVTRSGAAAACPDFPACGGLGMAGTPAGRLQDIHMLHRVAAAGAALVLGLALWQTWQSGLGTLRRLVGAAAVLLAVQIGLGISNVVFHLPMWSRGLHLVVAAGLWAAVVLLTAVAWKGWLQSLVSPAPAAEGRPA